MKYIIAAGLLQIVIALLLLFINNSKEKSDYLLAVLLAGIGWHLSTKFYIFTEVENPAVLFRMHTFVQLSYGPLLYLYAIKKDNQLFATARLWFLFIPLIISMTLYGCVVAALSMYPGKSDFVLSLYNSIVFLPIVGAHIVFGTLTLKKIQSCALNGYLLIRNVAWIFILVGFIEIVLVITSSYFPFYTIPVRCILYMLLGLVPILVVRYRYVARPDVGQSVIKDLTFEPVAYGPGNAQEVSAKQDSFITASTDQRGRKLLLDAGQHQQIYGTIQDLIKEKKLYREENFSLEKLADLSGYSRHYISETLNVFAQKSFYQYINEYRVDEVVRLLKSEIDTDSNILSIAYHAGFKNKASFNQYFKKITGSTPSDYQKKIKAAHEGNTPALPDSICF